jgi:hypothetical protein
MKVYKAIASEPARWWTVHDLQAKLPQYTGETIARKARILRDLKVLDWRRPVDRVTGGRYIDYRLAKDGVGRGMEYQPDTGAPVAPPRLSSTLTNQTAAPDGAGLLFDYPPDPELANRKGKGTR